MRVTRSKAKSGLADESLSQPESSLDDSTPPLPSDTSITPDQVEPATQNDSPLNGQTSLFEPKEASQETRSPSLPRFRDSTNIANNPFLVNDKASPARALKSSTNGIRPAGTPNGQQGKYIHVDTGIASQEKSATPTKSDVTPTDTPRKTALLPKSPANQLLSKDRQGMRSTSNKENMQPEASATAETGPPETSNAPNNLDQQVRHATVIHSPPQATGPEDVSTKPTSPMGDLVEIAITPVQEVAKPDVAADQVPEETGPQSVDIKPDSSGHAKGPRPSVSRPRQDTTPHQNEAELSASSSNSTTVAKKAEVYIPHAKPRPMSMSFPAPKPIPKGTKPPTVPTFKLPGEEVAARLKAAKEARLSLAQDKRASLAASSAADPPARPTFKARPVPKFRDRASLGLPVRETAASRARQSLMGVKPVTDPADGAGPSTSALKRSSTVHERSQQRPSLARVHAPAKAPPTAPRQSLSTFARAQMSKGALPKDGPARGGQSSSVSSRGISSSRASISQPTTAPTSASTASSIADEPPSATSAAAPKSAETDRPAAKTSGTGSGPGTGTVKGRQVFARAAAAQNAELAERRKKEEAIKLAREEASKRSREMVRKMADAKRAKAARV